ncbi:outer membrane beta-barrel protein [Persicitalea sp.]|uniref:outer membrane beta-barrel protein n=1 Tax=Persicitalea sp. TaxID=3100273 RepID=UPI003593BF56
MSRLLPFAILLFFGLVDCQNTLAQARIEGLGSHIPPRGVITIIGGAGVAYYQGDLSDGVDFAHLGLGPNLALGGLYRLSEHISLRSELRYYQLQADQKNSRNFINNLSFRTHNPDFYVGAQGDLFAFSQQAQVNPYLFGGIGTTFLNPKAQLDGTWYSLPPLTTEGVKYSRTPLLIVAGLGATLKLTDRWGLGLELCGNFLTSDYLDDASSVFPQPDQLPSDLARRLSDRSPEVGEAPRQPGFIRGNPKVKDSYIFLSVKVQYVLTTRYFAQQRKKTRCPKF